ncbi:hypothetical protein M1N04_00875 [Peptococcaceae bacterium]|nr:hypothetical protein [Peptococcaceae bacterium]
MNDREEYIKQLEAIISKFLEPLKDIPYPIAIKALTCCEVLHFDLLNPKNQDLLNLLKTAAKMAGNEAYKQGIFTRRPNEAGNHIEPFVVSALRKAGLRADKPRTKSGKIKVAGYPDIEITDRQGRIIYLDCKTYNTATKNQSFRTFYFFTV